MSRQLDRRTVLGGLILAGTTAGCARLGIDPMADAETTSSSLRDREAPSLAQRVRDGSLPSVEERLPDEPLVVDLHGEPGRYGGTLRGTMVGVSDTGWLDDFIGYEPLVRWADWYPVFGTRKDPFPEIAPNVARAWEASDDGREFTFHLRPGMRWSDGHPFSADDIMFWYDGVTANEDLTPDPSPWLVVNDELVQVSKLDEHTVRFTFAGPHGIFMSWMATPMSNEILIYPRHYLERFHKEYNPDVEQLVRKEGVADWVELFQRKGSVVAGTSYDARWQNPDLPRLHAWIPLRPVGESSQVELVRNPYYWKTDPRGRQLPYLDHIANQLAPDPNLQVLKTSNGEIDIVDTYIGLVTTAENKPILAANRDRGEYHFSEVIPNRMNLNVINLNLNHKNAVKREVYSNKTFRIGLSHAINRDEIINIVYLGQARPYQVAERPESPLFDEEMATQYTNYDVQLANRYLDEAGYAKRNGDGHRLGPDGRAISVVIEVAILRPEWIDSIDLVTGYWQAVGIDASFVSREVSLFTARVENNDHDAAVWSCSGGVDAQFDPFFTFPIHSGSRFAVLWAQWYETGGEEGEEPPEPAKEQMQLYDEWKAAPTSDERLEIFRQIMRIAKDQFYNIGLIQPTVEYGVVTNRLKNVPPAIASTQYPHPGPSNPCQFWVEG